MNTVKIRKHLLTLRNLLLTIVLAALAFGGSFECRGSTHDDDDDDQQKTQAGMGRS